MIKYFSDNKSYILVLIPIFVLGNMVLEYFFPTFDVLSLGQENLWNIDFKLIDPFLSKVLAFVLLCINAVLLNFVFNKIEFYNKFVYLPSILYVLIVFLFPMSLHFGEDLIGHFFFVLSFYHLLEIHQNKDARNNAFRSGLFLGIASTFLPIYTAYIFVIWFGLFTIRPFIFREYILPIVGLLVPFLWVALVNPAFINNYFSFDSFLDYSQFGNYLIFIPIIIIGILTLFAYKKMIEYRTKSSIRFKKINSITIFTFMFSIALSSAILLFFDSYFYFTVGIIVLPFILPYAYLNVKHKWLPNSLFYGLIVLNIIKFLY